MKRQVIQISVLQSSKIITILTVSFGLLLYLIGCLRVLIAGEPIRNMGILDLFVPVDFAVIGFFVFAIVAVLYNLLAKRLGGVEIQVKQAAGPAFHESSQGIGGRGLPMKNQITRISILQSSKIMTVLYVLIGFVYALVGLAMLLMGGAQARTMGTICLFMPIAMGLLGFMSFVIFSALYNLLARWLGGVEFEVKDS